MHHRDRGIKKKNFLKIAARYAGIPTMCGNDFRVRMFYGFFFLMVTTAARGRHIQDLIFFFFSFTFFIYYLLLLLLQRTRSRFPESRIIFKFNETPLESLSVEGGGGRRRGPTLRGAANASFLARTEILTVTS